MLYPCLPTPQLPHLFSSFSFFLQAEKGVAGITMEMGQWTREQHQGVGNMKEGMRRPGEDNTKRKKREAQVDCRQNPISIILVLILTLPPNLVFHPSCCCSSSIGICNKSRAEGRPQVKIGRRQHKAYDGSQPKRG